MITTKKGVFDPMGEFRTALSNGPLLFDGGMGTYFSQLNRSPGAGCELANLSQPELITRIHREYLEAGAQAIKTNTFAVNRLTFQGDGELAGRVIRAGWRLATEAATRYDVPVFADIGPVSAPDPGTAEAEFCWVADRFLEEGADCFLFETNATAEGLAAAAAHIKFRCPSAYIITSFAVQPDGFSREGVFAADLLREMSDCSAVDAVGLNCICGAGHMLELVQTLPRDGMTLALMPNAGYPSVRENRTFYDGDPDYFAEQIAEMAKEGAAILGGCCGTTPTHIAKAREMLDRREKGQTAPTKVSASPSRQKVSESPFWEKLQRGEKVIAVELDPPTNADAEPFLSGARELQAAGADILTIADCPVARVRMDSSLLACKAHRELGMDVLPHLTCRDRNQNATKALLLGLFAEGVRNVLLVTGDPVPTAERDEVKSVYQFNSRKLAAFVSALGEQVLPTQFHIFGALNLNAPNFDVQIQLAKEKTERGVTGFLTQPVLTHQAFVNLARARSELGSVCLLCGIIPVVSARNARYMDSEINGIRVDPQITTLYEGKTREESEALAVEISVEIARRVTPLTDGYYLITPFQRTGLVCRVTERLHRLGLA